VEADVYPSEIGSIKEGSILKVEVNGYADLTQTAKVDFISPELNSNTQRLTIRASIRNPQGQFQPGMQANVFLKSGGATSAISVPLSAVVRDEEGAIVWIKKGEHDFVPARVTTGDEDASRVLITSGLHQGDVVVVTGAYLLNSEFTLKKGSKI
jgi:Cu(I)/Ag(I) efflux system membrane fusion protein